MTCSTNADSRGKPKGRVGVLRLNDSGEAIREIWCRQENLPTPIAEAGLHASEAILTNDGNRGTPVLDNS